MSRSQPITASLSERLRAMPSSLNDACRTMEEAAEALASARKALEKIANEAYAEADYAVTWDEPLMIWQSVARAALQEHSND